MDTASEFDISILHAALMGFAARKRAMLEQVDQCDKDIARVSDLMNKLAPMPQDLQSLRRKARANRKSADPSDVGGRGGPKSRLRKAAKGAKNV